MRFICSFAYASASLSTPTDRTVGWSDYVTRTHGMHDFCPIILIIDNAPKSNLFISTAADEDDPNPNSLTPPVLVLGGGN